MSILRWIPLIPSVFGFLVFRHFLKRNIYFGALLPGLVLRNYLGPFFKGEEFAPPVASRGHAPLALSIQIDDNVNAAVNNENRDSHGDSHGIIQRTHPPA